MRKVLLTGGCGFIGSNLVRLLSERDHATELVVLDNETMGSPGDLPDVRFLYERGDILDQPAVERAARGCDTIIHLAAHTRVVESIADPTLNFEVNVRGTFNVLMAARHAGVKHVVLASTGGALLGDSEAAINEDMVPRPTAPYGASKLATEGYGLAFAHSFGLHVTTLRFSNVYGPLSQRKNSAVARFIRSILEGETITIYGDGSQTRDFVYVGDICRGIVSALEANVSGVFQLGTGQPTTINDLLGHLRAIVGPQRWPEVRYAPWRTGEVRNTYCDIGKAGRTFGYRPSTELADGLQVTWDWFVDRLSPRATALGAGAANEPLDTE